ncbi:MAG: peptidase C15 [Rhodomicrobium sp.]
MNSKAFSPVRVLVTGFGPFPDMPHNASAALAGALAQSAAAPGIEHFAEIVPVVWAEARAAAREAIARVRPDAVLHFGVSKRVTGFEIETRAVNMSGPKQDDTGIARPGTRLDPGGEPILYPGLPPFVLLKALRRNGFPAQLSKNAGRYLCNAVFYWSLADARFGGPLVSFIHMPVFGADTEVQPRLTLEEAVAGAQILVRASAEAVLRAKRGNSGNRGGSKGHGSQALHGTEWSGRRALWRGRR